MRQGSGDGTAAHTVHPFVHSQEAGRPAENERVVDEGGIFAGRGESASIHLGLHICRRLAGDDAMRKIKTRMDYPNGA